jgi:hypothetical protein
MDSDDEEMAAFLEEEGEVATAADYDGYEHAHVLTSFMEMYTRDAKPRCGGSKKGRPKSNPR